MNRIAFFLLGVYALLWVACGGSDKGPAQSNYLDSAYVSGSRVAVLESLRVSKTVDEVGFQALKDFTARNNRQIPKGWNWRQVEESARGYEEMNEGLVVKVASANQMTDMKVVEFHFHVSVVNGLDVPVQSVRGYFEILNTEGKAVGRTPDFAIEGPVEVGDSLTELRLEFAHDKPTGNELSDKKLSDFRDQLDEWVRIVNMQKTDKFRFVKLDLVLANGLSQDEYWLADAKERAKLTVAQQAATKRPALYAWTDKHIDYFNKMQQPLSGYFMVVTPVLTHKVEATHGKWLIFDRMDKIKKYYVGQKDVPTKAFNPETTKGKLLLREIIDFWGWPMEIRIYEGDAI